MTPFGILQQIGCAPKNESLFGVCRDDPETTVWLGSNGAIYLDHDPQHDYHEIGPPKETEQMRIDDSRRVRMLGGLANKDVLDFGCGCGGFVNLVGSRCYGFEPSYRSALELQPDRVAHNLSVYEGCMFDVITVFHVVEHLSDPVTELRVLRRYLKPGGILVVEVPHARDWLLHNLLEFRKFSLWSQHLILHTRDTIKALLNHAGYAVISIDQFQRYGLLNHLHWLTAEEPGCTAKDEKLDAEYARHLRSIDQTDTLVVYATVIG